MEDKINRIWYQMNMKEITSEQARQQVLDLFAVSNRRELLIAYELKLWINPTQEQIEIAEKIVDMYLRN
jgi:hypothetical protein